SASSTRCETYPRAVVTTAYGYTTARYQSSHRTVGGRMGTPVWAMAASVRAAQASASTVAPPHATYNGAAIAAHSARQVSEWVGPRCLTCSPRMNAPTIRTGTP